MKKNLPRYSKAFSMTKFIVNIFSDADFCCNLKSPDMVLNSTFKGLPGRSHGRGPLTKIISMFSFLLFHKIPLESSQKHNKLFIS